MTRCCWSDCDNRATLFATSDYSWGGTMARGSWRSYLCAHHEAEAREWFTAQGHTFKTSPLIVEGNDDIAVALRASADIADLKTRVAKLEGAA